MSNKYPKGYLPKLEYYTARLNAEVFNTKTPDMDRVQQYAEKLVYFSNRQKTVA